MPESLIALLVFGGFAVVFVAVIRAARAQRRARIARLQQIGFFEWKDPDQTLVARFVPLISGGGKKAPIGTVLRRTSGAGEMYTFLPHGDTSAAGVLIGRVPDLALPRFRLMRRPPINGRLGTWVVGLVTKLMGGDLQPVAFASRPDLAEQFLAFAETPAAFESFALRHWADLLKGAPVGFGLAGDRDLLAFSFHADLDRSARRRSALPALPSTVTMTRDRQDLCARLAESVRQAEQFIAAAQTSWSAHTV
ncbi:MAG TPA: hypothetical protein PLR32_02185 [candidate division Zixibacteria bacterium]|nr:hypothetical protein [candidate division Zixibacteria bacterium]MDD4917897.1 hypothetical protein [candidate division Zixibacteria bacterium]MDM7973491.1 hypothetical protein [candidate division Zixibacteria bacterium]HOD66219.1 hypothetical protein [candidate division Zixibacteria bacterium]HOZ07487.1 hypothetical protein [candidate division Zixibacteria bacterium]